MKGIRHISISVIQAATKNTARMNCLALSIIVKSTYASSSIKNFSYRKISSLTGMHRDTAKDAVEEGLKIGWCWYDKEDLVFKTLRRPMRKGATMVREFPKGIKKIKKELLAYLLADKLQNMTYAKYSEDMKEGQSPQCVTSGRVKVMGRISRKGLAKMWGCSAPTTEAITLHAIKEMKLIRRRRSEKPKEIKCPKNPEKNYNGIEDELVGVFKAYGKTFVRLPHLFIVRKSRYTTLHMSPIKCKESGIAK